MPINQPDQWNVTRVLKTAVQYDLILADFVAFMLGCWVVGFSGLVKVMMIGSFVCLR